MPGHGTVFEVIADFERKLAQFTGAPYAVMTDCCTHAIELCMRYLDVKQCEFTAFTYISIPMLMHKLAITYNLTDEKWIGEYQFHGTVIWDSARRLEPSMYKPGQMQCVSFGYGKPVSTGRGGAILLDDQQAYQDLLAMRYDGRRLDIVPWQDQQHFRIGYHYRPTPEEAMQAHQLLARYSLEPKSPLPHAYPDCRLIKIT